MAAMDLPVMPPLRPMLAKAIDHLPDDAINGARAVQFARGIVYVEQGRFWRADLATSTLSGPW